MLAHMHPSPLRFTCRTRPLFNGSATPARGPGPAKAHQVPRAPLPSLGVTLQGVAPPPREALPPYHRSYGLMRQSKTLPLPSVALYSRSLQVVASPCWKMAFPEVISASLSPDAWTLTPVGPYGAYARFFPQNIGLPRITSGSAPTLNPYSDFSTELLPGCTLSVMFKPPGLLTTQVAPTAVLKNWAAVTFTSKHPTVCYLAVSRIY